MQRLSYDEFKASSADFEQAVLSTPGIAAFCSSSDWIQAAHESLHKERELFIFHDDGHWLVMAAGPLAEYQCVLQPLESLWTFACPLIGPSPKVSVELFQRALAEQGSDYPLVFIGGIPRESSLHLALVQQLQGSHRLFSIEGCDCLQADISDSLDGFFSRRSAKFRAELKRAQRKAIEAKIRFKTLDVFEEPELLFERILAVEKASWKWQAGESIFQSDAALFYQTLFYKSALSSQLRVTLAQSSEGNDIAYAFGACHGKVFRGLQMGYDNGFREFSLGNLAQLELIEHSIQAGCMTYDLGMVIDYKARWAEQKLSLVNLFALLR